MWTVEWERKALKDVKKLDKSARQRIVNYLDERISVGQNPYQFGKPLKGNKLGLWRYRVGDYRILCQIEDKRLVVLVIAALKDTASHIGHRKDIYL